MIRPNWKEEPVWESYLLSLRLHMNNMKIENEADYCDRRKKYVEKRQL